MIVQIFLGLNFCFLGLPLRKGIVCRCVKVFIVVENLILRLIHAFIIATVHLTL